MDLMAYLSRRAFERARDSDRYSAPVEETRKALADLN
jgi:hypothetical protein